VRLVQPIWQTTADFGNKGNPERWTSRERSIFGL
jgi:hypothetical protein